MHDIARKAAQNTAALSYLDTETLALADILEALDDGPAEPLAPNVARKHRRRRRGAYAAATAALTAAAGVVGALALAPSASADSPFDNQVYQTAISDGWRCSPHGPREQVCDRTDGTVHGAVFEANEGADSTTFEATFVAAGKVVHTELTVFNDDVADDNADVTSLRSAMTANPSAYPNMRTGCGWLLWSTDATSADRASTALTVHEKAEKAARSAPTHAAPPATPSPSPTKAHRPAHAKPKDTPSPR